MRHKLEKRDDDERKKGRLAISFWMEFICSLVCSFSIWLGVGVGVRIEGGKVHSHQ